MCTQLPPWCLFFALAAYNLAWSAEKEDSITLQPQRDLHQHAYHGRTTIAVADAKLIRGAKFELDVRFVNRGYPHFFNPFFNSLTDQPAVVAFFDSDKKYIGDLRQHVFGSYVSPGADDWVKIPVGGYAGVKLEFVAGMVNGTPWGRGNELPAGKYYLQLIYRAGFATKAPLRGDSATIEPDALDAWHRHAAKLDLFRSNILEIELVDP